MRTTYHGVTYVARRWRLLPQRTRVYKCGNALARALTA